MEAKRQDGALSMESKQTQYPDEEIVVPSGEMKILFELM